MDIFVEYTVDYPEGLKLFWTLLGLSCMFVIPGLAFLLDFGLKRRSKKTNKPYYSRPFVFAGAFFLTTMSATLFTLHGMNDVDDAKRSAAVEALSDAGVADVKPEGHPGVYVGVLDGKVFYGKEVDLNNNKFAIVRATDEDVAFILGK